MLKRLVFSAVLLTFIVVVFGSFVRLSDAGLGCPDWPGCYGHIAVPESEVAYQKAQQNFPDKKIEKGQAWIEMIHRYLAGTLGLLILAIAVLSWRNRDKGVRVALPTILVGVVTFQALLGMWTVTLLLKPVIVSLHLLGGMTTFSLLVWLAMRHITFGNTVNQPQFGRYRAWAALGLVILFCQIALGGWVSSNYAALACPDFPTCQSLWLPPMDFQHAFHLVRELGVTAAGAPLSSEALTAIHWSHRVGALITFAYLLFLGVVVAAAGSRRYGGLMLVFLFAQVGLGISNVILSLPLAVAVAHNATAALLLASLVVVIFALNRQEQGNTRELSSLHDNIH